MEAMGAMADTARLEWADCGLFHRSDRWRGPENPALFFFKAILAEKARQHP